MPNRPLSTSEIETLLRATERQATRPERLTLGDVGAQVLQAMLAGLGMAIVAGICAALIGAPVEIALQIALTAGGLAAGIGLLLRIVPNNFKTLMGMLGRVRATAIDAEYRIRTAEFRLHQAYAAIQELEKKAAEIQRALDRMTAERDSAMLEKKRALEQAQTANNKNFVRASNTAAQVVSDAHEMLRYWAESNGEKWYSRNVANGFGWSDKRHRAAQTLLVDSGVVVINEKRPKVMAATLDAALRMLNDYVGRVDSVYVPDGRADTWEDAEDA